MIPFLFLLLQTAAPTQAIHDEPLTLPAIVYPASAKAARIQGTVQLQVDVDPAGHVSSVEALGGPILLRQAAIDAYSHATYRPVVSAGRPTPAIITTSVVFTLNELPPDTDLLVGREFQPLQARCQQLSGQHAPEALDTCRQTVELSRRFSTSAELEARVTAYNDLILLLIAEGKRSRHLPEADTLANQAIDLVSATSVHQPAVAVAYIGRAEVRSLAGNLKGAAADCATAEETLTTLLADEAENERAGNYRIQLKQTLELHAIVLVRDGERSQARTLQARADRI